MCYYPAICRPIVVPAGVELKISVSADSRNTAWVSFDGRKRQELCHGDSLRVTTSIYPIPSICAQVDVSLKVSLPISYNSSGVARSVLQIALVKLAYAFLPNASNAPLPEPIKLVG